MIVGMLGMSVESMDSLTVLELSWLLQNYRDKQKAHYEMIAYAVQVGFARANGKKIKEMFPKSAEEKVTAITPSEREEKLSQLDMLEQELNGGSQTC